MRTSFMRTRRGMIRMVTLVLAAALMVSACSTSGSVEPIRFGGQTYAEAKIIQEAGAILTEEVAGCPAETVLDLGGFLVVDEGMRNGEIDVGIGYTGGPSGLSYPEWADEVDFTDPKYRDPEVVLEFVQEMFWERMRRHQLDPFGFENTYAFAMRADRSQELGIHTISDLIGWESEFILGSDETFPEYPLIGWPYLRDYYGLQEFSQHVTMNINLLYGALRDQQIDVGVLFSSDARFQAYDLVWLEDDKNFFPPYYAGYLVQDSALERCPNLLDALNLLTGKIDTDQIRALNYKVDIEHREPRDVAREFLQELGLID